MDGVVSGGMAWQGHLLSVYVPLFPDFNWIEKKRFFGIEELCLKSSRNRNSLVEFHHALCVRSFIHEALSRGQQGKEGAMTVCNRLSLTDGHGKLHGIESEG